MTRARRPKRSKLDREVERWIVTRDLATAIWLLDCDGHPYTDSPDDADLADLEQQRQRLQAWLDELTADYVARLRGIIKRHDTAGAMRELSPLPEYRIIYYHRLYLDGPPVHPPFIAHDAEDALRRRVRHQWRSRLRAML